MSYASVRIGKAMMKMKTRKKMSIPPILLCTTSNFHHHHCFMSLFEKEEGIEDIILLNTL